MPLPRRKGVSPTLAISCLSAECRSHTTNIASKTNEPQNQRSETSPGQDELLKLYASVIDVSFQKSRGGAHVAAFA